MNNKTELLFGTVQAGTVLDLTPYLRKREHVGGGSYGDVYKADLVGLPDCIQETYTVDELPAMAVKVMRVAFGGSKEAQRKRLKVALHW